jgi:hypothetical protein
MYQEPGLAWLECQAEAAEQLLSPGGAVREAARGQHPGRQPDGPPTDAQVDVDVAAVDIARKVTQRGRSLPLTTGPFPESRSA